MSARPIKIAVMALGGQGGGVLADWIVKSGERAGYIAQSTSVPGVAQRTGATIYYVELFPKAAAEEKGKPPVLALMPTPGDVDVVIAAEMMEAGRALARGFLSKRTTLVASTHRVYAIGEKIAMGDGRRSEAEILRAVDEAVGRTIWFDMEKVADASGAVISAVLLGALAGSAATPISREDFEAAIRRGGRAVERNVSAFAFGFDAAGGAAAPAADLAVSVVGRPAPAVAALVRRVCEYPAPIRKIALEGAKRVVDFQDVRYGDLYLDRLEAAIETDRRFGGESRGFALAGAVAKYLAVAMAYDDVVRVADLKTRASRFSRCREDVRAADGQIVRIYEYMYPRLEEVCDMLPVGLAKTVMRSGAARRVFAALLGKGRRVATTNLRGFLLLSALSALRPVRRSSFRYAVEQARIEDWLDLIAAPARDDYALACEIAALQRLIKGYGDTHARGLANYRSIVGALDRVKSASQPQSALARLRDAALLDEDGVALRAELARLGAPSSAVA